MKKLPVTHLLCRWSVLAACALLLAACSRPEAPAEPVRAVKVVTVGASSLQSVHEFSGEVKPRVESRIGFRVAGKVLRRQAEVGQRVKAGQLLAQIDPQDYRLAADAARAQVAAATTKRDFAAAVYKRYVALKEQNFIAGVEVDRRESALKAAQAQLDQAQAQLASQGNQASYTDSRRRRSRCRDCRDRSRAGARWSPPACPSSSSRRTARATSCSRCPMRTRSTPSGLAAPSS